jgi:hypothetical protein
VEKRYLTAHGGICAHASYTELRSREENMKNEFLMMDVRDGLGFRNK